MYSATARPFTTPRQARGGQRQHPRIALGRCQEPCRKHRGDKPRKLSGFGELAGEQAGEHHDERGADIWRTVAVPALVQLTDMTNANWLPKSPMPKTPSRAIVRRSRSIIERAPMPRKEHREKQQARDEGARHGHKRCRHLVVREQELRARARKTPQGRPPWQTPRHARTQRYLPRDPPSRRVRISSRARLAKRSFAASPRSTAAAFLANREDVRAGASEVSARERLVPAGAGRAERGGALPVAPGRSSRPRFPISLWSPLRPKATPSHPRKASRRRNADQLVEQTSDAASRLSASSKLK